MPREFIERLIKGSDRLDQMKGDTDRCIRTLLELIKKNREWRRTIGSKGLAFCIDDDTTWELQRRGGSLHARCLRKGMLGDDIQHVCYTTDPSWKSNGQYNGPKSVVWAWESVPHLIPRLMRTFSGLEQSAEEIASHA